MPSDFLNAGFLSQEAQEGVASVRAENVAWFKLAEDMKIALMKTMMTATDHPAAHG